MKHICRNLAAAVLIVATSPSMAADPAHLTKLKKTKNCLGCDLRSADLFGADLARANPAGANL
jgi:uncharacterized protein YjbI with pentapeptide repeats